MENWRFDKAIKRVCRQLRAADENALADAIKARALEYGNTRSGRIAMCDGIRKLQEIETRAKQLALMND